MESSNTNRITPLSNERMGIVGMTGSGKSYFARYLLYNVPRLIVLDPKGTMKLDEWRLKRVTPGGLRDLARGRPARLHIPPFTNDDQWEEMFLAIMKLRNVTVYIDELYAIGPAQGSEGLKAIYTRGRELGIGVVAATQRPTWIPLFALSEAEWLAMFRLQLEEDVQRMSKLIGPEAYTPLPEHQFILYHNSGGAKHFREISPVGLD